MSFTIRALFVLCVALMLGSTVWAIVRRIALLRDKHTRRMASLWQLTGNDTLAEPGVSLLVAFDNVALVESLLTLDYLPYEVVVAGNLDNQPHLHEILARYSMMDMGSPVVESNLQRSARHLYRSRLRRYRRLVVVDTIGATLAERLDCALAVRSYHLCLPLPQGVTLATDALRVLVWRFLEAQHTSAVTAPTLAGQGARGCAAEMWQFIGDTQGCIALFEGDTITSLGGFSAFGEAEADPTTECIGELRRRGADITSIAVAIGRNPRNHPSIWLVMVVWTLLLGGLLGAILAKGEEQWMAVGSVVLVAMSGWIVAVLSRGLGRDAGTPRPWSEIWCAPLTLPRITKKMQ